MSSGTLSGACCPFSTCFLSPRGEDVTAEPSAFPYDLCGDVWYHSDSRVFILLLFFFLDACRIAFSVLTFHSDMSCCWPIFLQHRHSGNSCLLVLGNFLQLISLIISFTLRSLFSVSGIGSLGVGPYLFSPIFHIFVFFHILSF